MSELAENEVVGYSKTDDGINAVYPKDLQPEYRDWIRIGKAASKADVEDLAEAIHANAMNEHFPNVGGVRSWPVKEHAAERLRLAHAVGYAASIKQIEKLTLMLEAANAQIDNLAAELRAAQEEASWAPERAWNQLTHDGIKFYEVDENTDVKDAPDELVDKLCNMPRKIRYCVDPGDPSVGIPCTEWWVVEDTALLNALVKLARVGIDPDNLTLWVVGQYRAETDAGRVWDIQGVFSMREKAVAACRNRSYFLGPIKLNESLPEEMIEWPGCEWATWLDADGKAVTE